jgi:bifunctional non-homologous end joining protein LigD
VARWHGELPCHSCVIDGEILALDPRGRPSFQALQNAASHKSQLMFVAFDLLNLEEHSLLAEPLETRQALLKRLVSGSSIQLSEPIDTSLDAAMKVVSSLQLEGIVAKRRSSKYSPGARGISWFKFRIGLGQEFVIGGMKKGEPFESLLLGYYEGRQLHYAGKVKAGLRPVVRRTLFAKLKPLVTERCPFVNLPQRFAGRWGDGLTPAKMAKCVWVKPQLVAQVSFVEWTGHGNFRHPKFLGLRDDKSARDVVRER